MTLPTHSIVPILETDLPTLAQFIFTSNLVQPTNQFLFQDWPNEASQLSLYLAVMAQEFQDPTNEMYKVVNTSGEIIASIILTRKIPDNPTSSISGQGVAPGVPVGINPEFHTLMNQLLAEVHKYMVGIDHFVLSSIFVQSSSRSKGIRSQLVRLSLEKANTAKLPLFLSSVPSAYGFYKKLEFVDSAYSEIDLSKWGPKHGGFGVYRLQGMLAP